MKIIKRQIEEHVKGLIGKNKVILIMGTRRVGKTVLIKSIKDNFAGKSLMLNAEDFDVREILALRTVANYKRIFGETTLVIIDEAQVVSEIGSILKLMIDNIPKLTIIATGSSSFDLANKAGEPLTGCSELFNLYPLSYTEIAGAENALEIRQNLEDRLIFGSYPELYQLSDLSEKSRYLKNLIQSYLLKDILAFEGIQQSDKLYKLLRLIAYQCGMEVSYNELSKQLGISKNTVEKYLDLLTKVFIIYKLEAYSTNQRKEVTKSSKWYFFDNGIRNAIINDFRLITLRNDIGMLWENYLIAERIKKNSYERKNVQHYFWRNYNQQEIDLIENDNGTLHAYEIKYSGQNKVKVPPAFSNFYPDASFDVISRDNYEDWV